MKYLSIRSVTSKSAMTPSLSGRTATTVARRRAHLRRLIEHDPAAPDVHQGVRRTEVDRHVAAQKRQSVTHVEREPSGNVCQMILLLCMAGIRPPRPAPYHSSAKARHPKQGQETRS